MEILLTNTETSLIAVDKGGSRLDLAETQQRIILSKIKKRCPSCDICKGVTRVSGRGFIYENPTVPVPASCPANGETVTV